MQKLFVLILLCIPVVAFADVDISGCEVIGYQRGTISEASCETVESCNEEFADYPDGLARCLKRVKTPDECTADVAKRNADIESKNLLYRCPATPARLAQKDKPKDQGVHTLVYNDGGDIDIADLIADTENVYLFHNMSGIAGFVSGAKYSIIGPSDKDGLFMATFDE